MDEYIKREDAMKALDEYRLSHTMSMHGDMELLIEFRDGVIGAMNALAFVPTADVAPKSEVAREIIDEILEGLQYEIDQEDKLGRKAWDEGDTTGYHIHQYAEERLETLKTALLLWKATKGGEE